MTYTAIIGDDEYTFEAEQVGRKEGNVIDGQVEYWIPIYELSKVYKNDEPCGDYDEDELIEFIK